MFGIEDVGMNDISKSKINMLWKDIEALSMRT